MDPIQIRPIQGSDDPYLAKIIRSSMNEYGGDPATTVLADPELDHMHRQFTQPGFFYWTVLDQGTIVGGAGIGRLKGTNDNLAELQRMFLLPQVRGKGIGKQLMQACLKKAKELGYNGVYLETLNSMKEAQKLYKKTGFDVLPGPLGETGHGGCQMFMLLKWA